MNIGYQGIAGAYSEIAARKIFKETGEVFTGVPSFEDVFSGVHDGILDFGVVPIENSLAGSIHKNIDLLRKFDLSITGELYLRIHHNLLALSGSSLEAVTEVYSHPQALAQCEQHLRELLPHAAVREYFDTAGAAKYVADQNDSSKAAIASERAATTYNLKILIEGMEDDEKNFTRFVTLHKGPVAPAHEGRSKTSITFSGDSIPGFLYKALEPLAKRNINLTKIESRPIPAKTWHYFFYVDFEGNIDNPTVAEALEQMRAIAPDLKLLGSYPADVL